MNLASHVRCVVSVATLLASGAFAQERALFALPAETVRHDGHMVVRVEPRSPAELMRVSAIVTSIWDCNVGVGPLHVEVTPDQKAALESLDLTTSLIVPDVQAVFEEERADISRRGYTNRDDSWFTTYHTLDEFNAFIDSLVTNHPTLASSFTIGTSIEGRPIRGIRFTGPDQPGNPRSARPALLFNGGQHAREWINPAVTIYIAHKYLSDYASDPRIRAIVDSTETIVVPILNPDGYVYTWTTNRNWRKNRRLVTGTTYGVDLNRNWGYQWGGEGSSNVPSDETYRGAAGFSEPESAALRDLTASEPRIRAHIDFHSAALLILSPWAYTGALPADAALFDRINRDMAAGIQSVHGVFYRPGPTYTTIYPAAGAVQDWMYGERGILSFGIELRAGSPNIFVLPTDQIIPNCEEIIEGVKRLSEFVATPLWFSITSPLPAWASTTIPTPLTLQVRDGSQALDPSSVTLFSRTFPQSTFTPVPLVAGLPTFYPASIPPAPCGKHTEFYFEARSTSGALVRYPPSGLLALRSAEPYSAFADSFESDTGWTFGLPSDTASSGIWARGVPAQATRQPAGGASGPTSACLFTGLTAAAGDVDGGSTSATSPLWNSKPLEGMVALDAQLTYFRWYGTNQTSGTFVDSFRLLASPDAGASWSTLETRSTQAQAWTRVSIPFASLPRLSTQTQLRVVATDAGADNTIEAGFDDVELTLRVCRRSADLDDGSASGIPDGGVSIDDLLYFLAQFEAGDLITDYSNDDGVTIDDLLLYLQVFEEGF
jgi:murein tripeptide amidase MpaA